MSATLEMEATEPRPKHEMMLQGHEHSQRFTEQLVILWEEKQFSDVVLKANDGKELPCHRVVLAAASSYFKAMFNSGMVESRSPTVELENIDSDILSSLTHYMYSGSLKITADNVQQLVESCKPLDFPEIMTACEDFMVQELCAANCLGFKRFAQLYELERLKDAAQSTMLRKFSDVVRSTEFGELSAKEITQYISDSKLEVKTEDPVFEAVCMWVHVDPVKREALFPQIVAKVRFPQCTKSYLSSVVVPCPYMSNPECGAFLQEALTYHMMPEQRSRIISPRMVRRESFHKHSSSILVIFGGVNKHGTADCRDIYYCPDTGVWKPIVRFTSKDLRCYAVVAFDRGIFVTGGQESGILKEGCFLYDVKLHEWRAMPEMMEGRCQHGSVVQAENVYVLGGNLASGVGSSVEVYNKVSRHWSSVVAMPKGLIYPLAVSYGQYIFVTSGQGKEGQSVSTFVYDTVWDRWKYRKDMPKPVQYGSIAALKDKIYVVGGLLPSCLSYDIAEDSWTVLTPPNKAHGFASTLVSLGRIQIHGGVDATKQCTGIVENYVPATDTWSLSRKQDEPRAWHYLLFVNI